MNRRYVIASAAVALSINLAGAEIPATRTAKDFSGPISVYRDSDAFDPNGRLLVLGSRTVMMPEIHRQVVNEFVRRPGMGVGRMEPQFVPYEWLELVPESLGDGLAPLAESQPQPPRYDEFKETLTFSDDSKRTVRERVWRVGDVQLMSVDAKSSPAVYLNGAGPDHDADVKPGSAVFLRGVGPDHDRMKKAVATGRNTPTRKLDEFETRALARLRDGNDVALHSTADDMRMLGAIRARKECLECHKAEVGSLLGAFTYTLALQSPATPEADCLKDLAGLPRSIVGAVQFVESQGGKVVRAPRGPISEVRFTHTWTQNAERQAKLGRWDFRQVSYVARLKNSALDVLESFPELRVLDISNSMVTDDGLKSLARINSLRKVRYSPGYITEAGVAELKKALPDCAVEIKPDVARIVLP